VKEEAKRQAVILAFALVTLTLTVMVLSYAANPAKQNQQAMRAINWSRARAHRLAWRLGRAGMGAEVDGEAPGIFYDTARLLMEKAVLPLEQLYERTRAS
jgi:hypothetical protein